MKKKLFVLIGLILYTLQNIAQIQTANKPLKWDLKFSTGFSLDNPTEKDFTSNEWWPPSAITSIHNHIPWNLEVKRSLVKNVTYGISINKRGFEGTFFTQKQKFSSTGFSPVIIYNLKDLFLIGGGPSVYFVRHKDFNPDSKLVYKMSKIGFELKSSFRFPQKSRFYAQIDASYCFVGKIKQFEFIDVTAGPNDDVLFYYARNISMSYIYFGIGIGFRLYSIGLSK
jgi:urocanate hydratase